MNWICVTVLPPNPPELHELFSVLIQASSFGSILKAADSYTGFTPRSEQIVLKSNTVKLSGTSIHLLPRYIIYIINLSYLAPN